MTDTSDQFFVRETLKLAKKGLGWVNPNPMVGALIVRDGHILSSGYHHKAGLPHAEIEALNSIKANPRGATLYVNLEPCSHFGKTPPCTNSIIASGIKRVVCSTVDPNPKVAGSGIAALRKAGVEVDVGILKEEAEDLNSVFFTFHRKKRPYVALKFASSLDGKIATKDRDSKWITNEKARKFARKLRTEYQAVLVGVNTIVTDNPHLGGRIPGRRDPLRIILDPHLRIPLNSQVLRDGNVLVAIGNDVPDQKMETMEKMGIPLLKFEESKISVGRLLLRLWHLEIASVLVEGGSKTLGYFADSKLFDKVYAFFAPLIIGGDGAVSSVGGKGAGYVKDGIRLVKSSCRKLGDNYLITGFIS